MCAFDFYFNQSMGNKIWPNGLQSIKFGTTLNQSMNNVTVPSDFHTIMFGSAFDQSMVTVKKERWKKNKQGTGRKKQKVPKILNS